MVDRASQQNLVHIANIGLANAMLLRPSQSLYRSEIASTFGLLAEGVVAKGYESIG